MSIHEGHRQRMRRQLKTSGMDSLSDVQVLEVLLYYAIPRADTNPIAHRLLERFGSLSGVLEAAPDELLNIEGMGDAAAQLISLIPQLERRHFIDRSGKASILNSTSKCGQYLVPFFHGEQEEVVYLLCLDAKCKAICCVPVHRGSITAASISIRKIVQTALNQNAASVVLAHNHPSGYALPSPEDLDTTRTLQTALQAARRALDTIGVTLADHIIVADDDFVSLADDGFLGGSYGL